MISTSVFPSRYVQGSGALNLLGGAGKVRY